MNRWLMMAAILFAAAGARAVGDGIEKPENNETGAAAVPINLYNPAESQPGFYVYWQTGRPMENPDYDLSGFIAVKPLTWYTASRNRMLAFYDRNLAYISGLENGPAPFRFKTPADAAYLRISVRKSWSDGFRLREDGPEAGARVNLPKTVYASDRTAFNIYNDALTDPDNPGDCVFRWSCPVGRSEERGFAMDAGTAAGEYPLKVEIFDSSQKKLDEASAVLKVMNTTGERRHLKLLAIGDSLTNGKPWLAALRELADGNCGKDSLELVGGRGAAGLRHEGRSGYSSGGYSSNSSYGYEGSYKFRADSQLKPPPPGTCYATMGKNGVRLVFELEDGYSEPDGVWLYMKRITGTGDAVENGELRAVLGSTEPAGIAYDSAICTEDNPFWNQSKKAVDFKYYEQNSGVRPDVVLLMLGTNDYDSSAFHDNMEKLINACNRDWNVPILLVLPPFRGPQDVMDRQKGDRMFAEEARRVMYNQHRRSLDELAALPNVVIVPVSACFDSLNNYGCFNGRWDAVHPLPEGYRQFATVIFGALLSVW